MTVFLLILIAVIGYVLGNFSGCGLLTQLLLKKRQSKYAVAECSLSEFSKDFGYIGLALLLVVEIVKTALAVLMGGWLLGTVHESYVIVGRVFGAFALLMGQCYPALHLFRGGRGLLNAAIAVFVIDWRVGVCCWVVYVVVIIFTRYAVMGALVAAVAAPLLLLAFDLPGLPCTLMLLCTVLLVLSHLDSLLRLLGGKEPHCFTYGQSRAKPQSQTNAAAPADDGDEDDLGW